MSAWPPTPDVPPPHPPLSRARLIGLGVVFAWFFVGGLAHFFATELEMSIVPPAVPWPRAVVLASGAFELLGSAGLMWPSTRRAAGIGLMILTVLVTPAHFYMLERPELFDVPYWALVLRLPLQAALLALIFWSTGVGQRRAPRKPTPK